MKVKKHKLIISNIMNRFTFLILLCLLISFNSYAQQNNNNDTIILTLDTAKQLALEQNPALKATKLNALSAQYQLDESRGNLLPHFNIGGTFNKNIKRPVMFLPEQFTGIPGGGYMEIGSEYNYRATLSGSMPLYSPAIYANIKANRIGIEHAEEEYRGAKIDLEFNVQQAYFNTLLAKESKEVIRLSFENALENLEHVRKMYSQGLVTEYDKIRAEVQTENLSPEVAEMENAYEMAVNFLKMLIGIEKEQPVKIEGDLLEVSEQYSIQFQVMEPGHSLAKNSDLRQMDLNINMLKEQSKAVMSSAYPSIFAMGNYNYQTDADDLKISDYTWVETFSAGLQLSIPIFQGFTVKRRAKQIDVAAKQIQFQKEYLEDNLRVQLDNELKKLNVAVEKSAKAQKNVALAERGYEIAKTRYASGQGTLLEVNDSEMALTRARFNLLQAKYEILMAIIEYGKYVGGEF